MRHARSLGGDTFSLTPRRRVRPSDSQGMVHGGICNRNQLHMLHYVTLFLQTVTPPLQLATKDGVAQKLCRSQTELQILVASSMKHFKTFHCWQSWHETFHCPSLAFVRSQVPSLIPWAHAGIMDLERLAMLNCRLTLHPMKLTSFLKPDFWELAVVFCSTAGARVTLFVVGFKEPASQEPRWINSTIHCDVGSCQGEPAVPMGPAREPVQRTQVWKEMKYTDHRMAYGA